MITQIYSIQIENHMTNDFTKNTTNKDYQDDLISKIDGKNVFRSYSMNMLYSLSESFQLFS